MNKKFITKSAMILATLTSTAGTVLPAVTTFANEVAIVSASQKSPAEGKYIDVAFKESGEGKYTVSKTIFDALKNKYPNVLLNVIENGGETLKGSTLDEVEKELDKLLADTDSKMKGIQDSLAPQVKQFKDEQQKRSDALKNPKFVNLGDEAFSDGELREFIDGIDISKLSYITNSGTSKLNINLPEVTQAEWDKYEEQLNKVSDKLSGEVVNNFEDLQNNTYKVKVGDSWQWDNVFVDPVSGKNVNVKYTLLEASPHASLTERFENADGGDYVYFGLWDGLNVVSRHPNAHDFKFKVDFVDDIGDPITLDHVIFAQGDVDFSQFANVELTNGGTVGKKLLVGDNLKILSQDGKSFKVESTVGVGNDSSHEKSGQFWSVLNDVSSFNYTFGEVGEPEKTYLFARHWHQVGSIQFGIDLPELTAENPMEIVDVKVPSATLKNKLKVIVQTEDGEVLDTFESEHDAPRSYDTSKIQGNILNDNYTIVTINGDETGNLADGDNKEVVYIVKRNVSDDEVLNNKEEDQPITKYVDKDGNELLPPKDGTNDPEDIPGYKHVDTQKDEKGNTIHVYEQVREVITKHVDKDGNELLPQEDGKQDKKEINGYKYVDTTVDDEGNTTHVYEKVYLTKFVDKNGNTLADTIEDVTTHGKKDIPNYEFVETVTDEDGNVTHIYEQKPEVTPLTTKFVDKDGNQLADPITDLITHGPKDIPGYKLVDTKTDENGNVTHIYAKDSEFTTDFVDKDGNKLDNTIVDKETHGQKDIPGYKYVETITDENGNVKHVYVKDQVLTPKTNSTTTASPSTTKLPSTGAATGLLGVFAGLPLVGYALSKFKKKD